MNALTRQERYRRRVLLKAKLYDNLVEQLGPLRNSNEDVERILAEHDTKEQPE